jgi:hypothetical protein
MRGHVTFYLANVIAFFMIGLSNLAALEEKKAGSAGDRR